MMHPSIVRKQRVTMIVLCLLLIGTIIISISTGYSKINYSRILPTLLGNGDFKESFILYSVRLPRLIITVLSGMALALSGAILQGITRNDLADPGIIGINSGAGVAVAVFFLFFPIDVGHFSFLLPVAAIIGAFMTAACIYLFSYDRRRGMQPVKLIITGVGFSLALSGLMVVLISSSEREKVDFIAKWLAGNIWGTDWPFIWALLPWLIIFVPIAFYRANKLNIMQLSEPAAIGVGLAIEKERIIMLIIAVALAASAVSVSGGIAFIGLMAPHIARALVGQRAQLFMPVAVLLGGWLLLLADTIGRNLIDPDGIPAGIMVALIGAPYFIYLLKRKDNQHF